MSFQTSIRSFFLFTVVFSASVLHAQITIENSDLPAEGSSYYLSAANPVTDYDFTLTGPNYSWDFSDLEFFGQQPQNYVAISEAPLAYQFVFNNPFDPEHYADFANAQDGFDLGGQFTFEDFYAFYQSNPDAYNAVGFAGTINGIPLPAGSSPVDTVYSLPMNYEDSFEGYSEWLVQIPGIVTYKLKQTRSYEVDGWGTVTTPYGSFEALRVRMQIDAVDSISVEALSFSFENERNSVEYQWLSPGEGVPVLQATESFGFVSNISYKDEQFISVEELNADFQMYPNPSNGSVIINAKEAGNIKVYNSSLQLVKVCQMYGGQQALDLSELPKGIYFVRLGEDRVQKLVLK